MNKHKGYDLTKDWWNYAAQHEHVRPVHSALYFFIIHLYNKLAQPAAFNIPTDSTMDLVGVKNYKTYKKAFDDLCNWGFISITQKSKNQYTASTIALVKNTESLTKPNTKADNKTAECFGKKYQGKSISNVDLNKPLETLNKHYVNNKLKVGVNFFDLKPFEYLKTHHPITLDQFRLIYSEADFTLFEKMFNDEYIATGFNSEDHAKNAAKSILKKLIQTQNGNKINTPAYLKNGRFQSIGTGTTKEFSDGHSLGT